MTIWGNRTDTLGRVTQYPNMSKMYEPYDSVSPTPSVFPRNLPHVYNKAGERRPTALLVVVKNWEPV